MSDSSLINNLLGLGYLIQAVLALLLLRSLLRAKVEELVVIFANKPLWSELLILVGVISATVSAQNWYPVLQDSPSIFVWRVLLNGWACGLWLRWYLIARNHVPDSIVK